MHHAFQSVASAATARPSTGAAADTFPQAGGGGAPANPSKIPPHMIATVRNNQLPTAELAELLNVSPADIDAIRALGPYCGGDLLEANALIVRDLGSAVVL